MSDAIVPADFAVAWLATRSDLLADASSVVAVNGDAELEFAGKVEAGIKKALKKLETERKAVTAPLDEAKKAVMAKEKELAAPLQKELTRINAMTTAYATEVARRVEAERREQERREREAAEAALAAEEAAAADPFGFNGASPAQAVAPEPVPVATTAMPRTSANRFVEKWDFKVFDERSVPREFLSVDERKIRAFLAAKKAEGYKADQITVAGINIFATMQVYSR